MASLCSMQDVPGKGKGLIASENIPKGTRILSEKPVITVPTNDLGPVQLRAVIRQQLGSLSEDQRRLVLSLHNIYPYENDSQQYDGIIRTNGLPIEKNGIGCGIFLEACRINHACDNNAQKEWNENIKQHTVHALRDIKKGEEITIYYLAINKSRKDRRDELQARFGFECACQLCSLPPKESKESDERLKEIHRLDNLIGEGGLRGITSSPLQTLRYVEQQVSLYNKQGKHDSGLGRVYFDAAQIAIANSDLARGRFFMENALSVWTRAFGMDSKQVLDRLRVAFDPAKHELYGLSAKWKTSVDEAPYPREHAEFEDWLWRKEKAKPQGQLTNLRDLTIFPNFNDLPEENELSLDFFEMIGKNTCQPSRSWCSLSEIEDFTTFMRFVLAIKDVDGRRMDLAFYTEDRGTALLELVKKGNTVAVLYAQRKIFMDGSIGIRQEDLATIKIFPMSLQNLLSLNDRVQEFSTSDQEGNKTCHGCNKKAKAASLNRCARCLSFWYCDKDCQENGWHHKGHKGDCKHLRDPDLRGLFAVNWDKFENYIQFPLQE